MELERNYIYTYQPGGNFHNSVLRFYAPEYFAEISSEDKMGLTRFGFVKNEQFDIYKGNDLFSDSLSCEFQLIKNGKNYKCIGSRYPYTSKYWYWCAPSKFRIIEAGRFYNKVDIMYMTFEDHALLGRFEMSAMPDCFLLKFDGYNDEQAMGGVRFSVTFPNDWEIKKTKTGARLVKGKNFLGVESLNASLSVQGNTIVFSNDRLTLNDSFKGIAARFNINRDTASECNVKILKHNQERLDIQRQADDGVYRIDMSCRNLDFNVAEDRNRYDRVAVSIENTTDQEQGCMLCFAKEGDKFPITGMSPVWRDMRTGEPNGMPIQITKDWHIHPDPEECNEWFAIPKNSPRRYLEGKWSHLYSYIRLKPHTKYEGEFVCVYENWGTAPAVSHAQLSLVGWGGYDIWEQLAVGSHGENICFQADTSSQGVSFINDIRPLYTRGRHGGFRSYDWSDNVGGGELLVYYDKDGNRVEFTEILRDFKEQCPVLSEADYKLKTKDGKIAASLIINNVRTDDVLKIYFNVEYFFLEDTEYKRLALFQYDTERYQANLFRKLAHGEGSRILEEINFKEDETQKNGYNSNYESCRAAGKESWFYFYDLPEKRKGGWDQLPENKQTLAEGKNATVLFILREYEAKINGTDSEARYSIRQCYSSDILHQSVEINPWSAEGKIAAGSSIAMCLELICLPSDIQQYYGNCSYLLRDGEKLDTPECAIYQVEGDRLQVLPKIGKLKRVYPLVFECEDDACSFILQGGLGYVPMRFENLQGYSGYSLYRNGKKVDQSVCGNDFWQTYRDENGTYALSFSVPNEGEGYFELKKTNL